MTNPLVRKLEHGAELTEIERERLAHLTVGARRVPARECLIEENRVLQQLRDEGLIGLQAKRLTIHDAARLKEFAGFDPNYLHLRDAKARAADLEGA